MAATARLGRWTEATTRDRSMGPQPIRPNPPVPSGFQRRFVAPGQSIGPGFSIITRRLLLPWVSMPKSAILELSVLAGLFAYLIVSIARRHFVEIAKRRAWRREWPRRAFELSSISHQVERLRQDYVASIHARAPDTGCRRRLLVGA